MSISQLVALIGGVFFIAELLRYVAKFSEAVQNQPSDTEEDISFFTSIVAPNWKKSTIENYWFFIYTFPLGFAFLSISIFFVEAPLATNDINPVILAAVSPLCFVLYSVLVALVFILALYFYKPFGAIWHWITTSKTTFKSSALKIVLGLPFFLLNLKVFGSFILITMMGTFIGSLLLLSLIMIDRNIRWKTVRLSMFGITFFIGILGTYLSL